VPLVDVGGEVPAVARGGAPSVPARLHAAEVQRRAVRLANEKDDVVRMPLF
jgi:hypothetical protein